MDLVVSDHKPVSAVFHAGVKVIDRARRQKIKEEIMKRLDMLENDFLPQVMVDKTDVIYDNVNFIEPASRALAIANTGQVPVSFEFIKKPGESSYARPWLQAEPSSGFIMPGEKADVSLDIYVDKRTAHSLNSGQDKLYDILVLHLMGGKDIFITVSGTYIRCQAECSAVVCSDSTGHVSGAAWRPWCS
jgi:phosphatidylinositol-bisphosphatase